ncbi:hypothetical protein F511_23299 [Dorcoceras hygrometricum]|uniref:Uncharacterized protein n=1 Tax=Dorcoceras hygrometricum TaxID=472368 RepID=A0A2Z7BMT3_9LAMI|nr:hypothetical protein F511_23299 [Dorcoceras hygrometricum]
MPFLVVRTNQYNQDLGLIHSTNGNHLESPNEDSSIDHQGDRRRTAAARRRPPPLFRVRHSAARWLSAQQRASSGRSSCAIVRQPTSKCSASIREAGGQLSAAISATSAQINTARRPLLSASTRDMRNQAAVFRQSGPRPEGRLLRQPTLEGLTRSARTDSPRKTDRSKSDQSTAAAAARGKHHGCGGAPPPMLNTLSSVSVRESRIKYLCDPQWFRDTASRGPTTIVAPESQFRTCPSDHDASLELGRPYPHFDGPID